MKQNDVVELMEAYMWVSLLCCAAVWQLVWAFFQSGILMSILCL
jgi:hypothetical protein